MTNWGTSGRSRLRAKQGRSFARRARQRANVVAPEAMMVTGRAHAPPPRASGTGTTATAMAMNTSSINYSGGSEDASHIHQHHQGRRSDANLKYSSGNPIARRGLAVPIGPSRCPRASRIWPPHREGPPPENKMYRHDNTEDYDHHQEQQQQPFLPHAPLRHEKPALHALYAIFPSQPNPHRPVQQLHEPGHDFSVHPCASPTPHHHAYPHGNVLSGHPPHDPYVYYPDDVGPGAYSLQPEPQPPPMHDCPHQQPFHHQPQLASPYRQPTAVHYSPHQQENGNKRNDYMSPYQQLFHDVERDGSWVDASTSLSQSQSWPPSSGSALARFQQQAREQPIVATSDAENFQNQESLWNEHVGGGVDAARTNSGGLKRFQRHEQHEPFLPNEDFMDVDLEVVDAKETFWADSANDNMLRPAEGIDRFESESYQDVLIHEDSMMVNDAPHGLNGDANFDPNLFDAVGGGGSGGACGGERFNSVNMPLGKGGGLARFHSPHFRLPESWMETKKVDGSPVFASGQLGHGDGGLARCRSPSAMAKPNNPFELDVPSDDIWPTTILGDDMERGDLYPAPEYPRALPVVVVYTPPRNLPPTSTRTGSSIQGSETSSVSINLIGISDFPKPTVVIGTSTFPQATGTDGGFARATHPEAGDGGSVSRRGLERFSRSHPLGSSIPEVMDTKAITNHGELRREVPRTTSRQFNLSGIGAGSTDNARNGDGGSELCPLPLRFWNNGVEVNTSGQPLHPPRPQSNDNSLPEAPLPRPSKQRRKGNLSMWDQQGEASKNDEKWGGKENNKQDSTHALIKRANSLTINENQDKFEGVTIWELFSK